MNEKAGHGKVSSLEMGLDTKERNKFVENSTVQESNKKNEPGGKNFLKL